MREKILVVGAEGLVGQSLVHNLNRNGYEVVPAIKSNERILPFRTVTLNLESENNIKQIIDSETPDI